jgi:hypothetical protein
VAALGVGVLTLAGVRPAAATALEPLLDTDPYVFEDVVDALQPPALMLAWDDPWLEAGPGRPTMGPCIYTARLRVICCAPRLMPGSGVDELERLVSYVLTRLRADSYAWALDRVSSPEQVTSSGIDMLRAEVTYTITTTA